MLTIAVALLSLCVGAIAVPLLEVVTSVLRFIGLGSVGGSSSLYDAVVVDIRFPRVVAATCVGASLGAAGCILQALLRNPLASPFVVGASSAASLGAVLGLFLGLPYLLMLGSSFGFATAGGAVVLLLARTRGRLPTEAVVLVGFGVGLLFSAATGLVQYLTRDEGQLRAMVLWLLGGLWHVTWTPLVVQVPLTLVALLACLPMMRRLDLISLGEFDALRLGLEVSRARTIMLLLACLLTALAVSLAGVVAFVGLLVPHIARRLVGVAHRRLLPASAIAGALFLVGADTACRTLFLPHELPLGIVSSMVGAPFFIALLQTVKHREAFL
ncbi:MAG: iron ABC transporter permease [Planctomycetota bacterium]